jgi:hypothetical protein
VTNVHETPNVLHIHGEHTRVSHPFGELRSCRPVLGHDAIRSEFAGHMGMEVTRAVAAEWVRRMQEALASTNWPDVSGSCSDIGGAP